MSNKIKDETFSKLSFDSYEDRLLKVGSVIRTVDGKFVVINSIDKESGLQAVAVVNQADYDKIQKGGEPDNIIFVSRGSSELKDWTTNFNQLGTNLSVDKIKENSSKTQYIRFIADNAANTIKNPILSHSLSGWSKGSASDNHQFIEYEKWVNKVVKNRKTADYSFTGHSLGGALAQFMGVMNNKNATTFSAARSYRILPKKYRDSVDQGYYNNKIRDYRHELDPVGFVPLGKTIEKLRNLVINKA
ncbi:lipase family protein [Enterococcus sp. AZ126]|uniref:lipase family protein n=1 Tax=Enterococcus sp. AZ126 TaxID=2774635 RepID=UPI003F2436C9